MNQLCRVLTLGIATTLGIRAVTYTVGYQKTISVSVPGATAAYTIDPLIAEASADQGMVAILGKGPGGTHLVVITPGGVQTMDIVVPMPPPNYPKGWVTPESEGASNENGYLETVYSSLPEELTNILDFSRDGEEINTHFHLATTELFPSSNSTPEGPSVSKFAVISLSYSMQTDKRTVVLVDQRVDESPLTVNGSVIRGLHWQEGDWFFHGGFTSGSTFDGLFLPVRAEGVFGAGYRYRFREHARLIPSFYYLTVPAADQTGRAGGLLSLLYSFEPSDSLHFAAEIAESRGLGASSTFNYRRHAENLKARFRYTPERFAALSTSNFHGLYSDLSWTRQWSSPFGSDLSFTGDRFNLPEFQEASVNGGLQLRYRPLHHWTLSSGATYSLFHTEAAGQSPLEGVYYPQAVSFNSHHFGGTFQHQWSRFTAENSGGHQYLASAQSGFGHLSFSGYAEHETQAPTVGFLVSQVNGLAQLMSEYGVTAITPQQIIDFLNQNSALINLQYLHNVSIGLTPVREQVSGSVNWQGHGFVPQIEYAYLLNNDRGITNDEKTTIQRITFTQRLGRSNDLSLTFAEYSSSNPGQRVATNFIVGLTLRHHLNTVPSFLTLEHHGTVKGRVFEDPDGQGAYSPSAPGVAGVEIILDNSRRTKTNADGSYSLPHVQEGKHELLAVLHGGTPYYFTTPEQVDVSEDAETYFGIARSLASLGGEVLDDIPHGVSGISVMIRGGNRRITAVSGSDGKFLAPRLSDGEYVVSVDAESLPAGYVIIEEPREVSLVTAATNAPRATLKVRALRNAGGQVLLYDTALGRYVGVPGITVTLAELSLKKTTDAQGRFLFRELASGTFTLSAEYQGHIVKQTVTLPDQPTQLTDIKLMMGQR